MKYVYILLLTIPINIECMLHRSARIQRWRKILKNQPRLQPVRYYNAGHPLDAPENLLKQIHKLNHTFLCMEERITALEKNHDMLLDILKVTINDDSNGYSFIPEHNMHYTNPTQPAKE